MHYTNQLQDLFDLIGDAIHLIGNIFDGLGLKFAGVPITFEMLFGAGIVMGLINVLFGYEGDDGQIETNVLNGYDGDDY